MRNRSALKGMVAGIVWSVIGVTAGSVVFASPAQPVFAKSTTGQTSQTTHNTHIYKNMPSGVAAAIPSVVSLQRINQPHAAQASQPNGLVASGVIINDEMVLTAGHTVVDNDHLACGQSHIEAPGAGRVTSASRESVRLGAVKYGNGHDIGLLKVAASQNFRQLPDIALAVSQPKKGEAVYFVNYQPKADGQLRSPALWNSRGTGAAADVSRPAVFKGIVLGNTAHGYIVATNVSGQSTQSPTQDTLLRQGGSGGAVLNAKGQLVGLSVAVTSQMPDHSAQSLVASYGVKLRDGQYQVTRTQAVTQSSVAALQAGLKRCD